MHLHGDTEMTLDLNDLWQYWSAQTVTITGSISLHWSKKHQMIGIQPMTSSLTGMDTLATL